MDKLEILLDMTEHPDRYTEDEIKELLADEDMRKHYQMMVWLRESQDPSRSSLKEREKRPSPTSPLKGEAFSLPLRVVRMGRYAAAFVGAVVMAGLLFAAMRPFFNIHNEERTDTLAQVTKSLPLGEGQGDGSALRFDNAPLDSILTVVAQHYGKVVLFRNEEIRTMRLIMTWQPTDSLSSLIGRLNLFDGLQLTLQADTIIVEIEKKEGE
jgi:hypothetical protein